MSKVAIRVERLSKQYRLGAPQPGYRTLRESFAQALGAPWRGRRRLPPETIWALRDVSFEVGRGEVVGVIGRNGAGKSTLLKILSRITYPSQGRAEIHGRVGSLLEVGTGFHPELTGRENVYLNGAILGMKKAEIERQFDQMVTFAEVEKFIDTPVKYYSSGMRVRLAFAVAAHLEPEILLVDEVLAVGDIAFQKKCFDKMETVGRRGKTVLVVSHNMASIIRLCERALLLNSGCIECDGPATEVVGAYMRSDTGLASHREWNSLETAPGDEVVRLKSIKVCAADGQASDAFDIRYPILIEFEYWVCRDNVTLNPSFSLLNEVGTIVFISGGMHDPEWLNRPRRIGLYRSRCWIPGNLLAEGTFSIHATINAYRPHTRPIVHVYEKDAVAFQVYDTLEGDSARGPHRGAYYGVVRPILKWETYLDGGASLELDQG